MSEPIFWLRYLPSTILKRIEHRPSLLRILENTSWLFFDKILRIGMGMLVGVWIARYLGPEQFGLFNYATAIVALFTAVASLGLNSIVVRDLVRQPDTAGTMIGTAFVLQVAGGALACVLAILAVTVMRPNDDLVKLMVAVLGLSMLFKASEVIKYWFEFVVQSKYTVWVENSVFLLFAAIKVGMILCNVSLMGFVWAVSAESAVVAVLLFGIYHFRGHGFFEWGFKKERAKSLLSDSWPLALSGVAAMIYMRIDQIMLGQMLNDQAVGIYSAALRLSEVWYFIPMAIAGSVFPSIVAARENNLHLYYARIQALFNLMVILALAVAIPISFLAGPIVELLYGKGYSASADILVVHVWAGLFVFLGVASSRWFVSEGLQKYTFYRTLAGCIINVVLNYFLIPKYGPIGAAWSSVVSQAVASVLFNFINAETRPIFYMQIWAILGIDYWPKLRRIP